MNMHPEFVESILVLPAMSRKPRRTATHTAGQVISNHLQEVEQQTRVELAHPDDRVTEPPRSSYTVMTLFVSLRTRSDPLRSATVLPEWKELKPSSAGSAYSRSGGIPNKALKSTKGSSLTWPSRMHLCLPTSLAPLASLTVQHLVPK
jgi:hypothetical protein